MGSRETSPQTPAVPTTSNHQTVSPTNPPTGYHPSPQMAPLLSLKRRRGRSLGGVGRGIQPTTPSEWLCYTVLHHANLLQYYSTFIAQGGDDVPQLMEAGEEEFLEIMALVGMAQKPLHVRRLQKALQEFSLNPAHFNLLSMQHQAAAAGHGPLALFPTPSTSLAFTPSTHLSDISLPRPSAAQIHRRQPNPPPRQEQSPSSFSPVPTTAWNPPVTTSISIALPSSNTGSLTPGNRGSDDTPGAGGEGEGGGSEFEFGSEGSVVGPSPGLTEEQVARITACTRALIPSVPQYQPKLVQNKKKISPALKAVMEMPPGTGAEERRVEEYRRYAAIYGRFDAKRKADKRLTLHEVSVNEAAAQICLLRPALLTRRDELFPLARQVVRDAGYNYVKPVPGQKRGLDEDPEQPSTSGKRGTPAESTGSSGERSRTPGSSAPCSPPAPVRTYQPSGLHTLGLAATHLAMQGSPSSSGTSGGSSAALQLPVSSAPLLSTGLHHFGLQGLSQSTSVFVAKHRGLGRAELDEKLDSVKGTLARVMEKQKIVERRVMSATDISACFTTNAELRSLAQRQVELLNEQTALEALLKEQTSRDVPTLLIPKAEPAPAKLTPERERESEGEDSSGEVEVGCNPQPPLPPSTPSATPPPRMTRLASKRERLMKRESS